MRQINLRTGLLLLMLLVFTGLQAQKKLYIQAIDGTKSSILLSEIRKVTFPSRTLIVYNNNGNTQSFPFIELRQARFNQWLTGNSILELQENNSPKLFPNPVNNQLTLKIGSPSGGSVEVRIQDVQGKTVYTQAGSLLPGNNQLSMELSFLPRGLYVCRINDGRSIEVHKFLKD